MAARTLLVAALIAGCPAALAEPTAPRSATASIDLTIQIPRILQARLMDAPSYVELEQAGGEAAGTLSYEVLCTLASYEVRVGVEDPQVEEVWIEGLGATLRFGREGAAMAVPVRSAAERRERRTLSYRVRFAAGTRAGRRAVPLSVSFAGP